MDKSDKKPIKQFADNGSPDDGESHKGPMDKSTDQFVMEKYLKYLESNKSI